MRDAIGAVGIEGEVKEALYEFFEDVAIFLRNTPDNDNKI